VSFTLNQPASVSIDVRNAQGTVVRHMLSGTSEPAGASRVQWSPVRDDNGRKLGAGTYGITVTATAAGTTATDSATLQITSGGNARTSAMISGLTVRSGPVVPRVRRTLIWFRIPHAADVFVHVRNARGGLVRTLRHLGWMHSGRHVFRWAGWNNSLHAVRPGAYRIVVGASTGPGRVIRARTIHVARRTA
jgi:flagellar hook assembly protein FlgD